MITSQTSNYLRFTLEGYTDNDMQSNIKRLAKNTFYMYIRLGLTTIISLYSSRVLLNNLGVDSFGVINLVGSVVALVSTLQSSFSSATLRFVNFEMGKKNYAKISKILNISIIINIIIAIIFFIVIECIGYWFISSHINVLESDIGTVKIVLHLSVLTAIVMIILTPFNALVSAREHFDFYSIISVAKYVGTLLVALCIPIMSHNQLIEYSFFILCVNIAVLLIYVFYCLRHFPECEIKITWDSLLFKELFSFTGWQFLGVSSYNITQNAINMLFNVFGGTVVNAAKGISDQVVLGVNMLANNLIVVLTPYSIKAYSEGNSQKFIQMFYFSSKSLFLMVYALSVPILLNAEFLLRLWLGSIPDYTIAFIQLMMIYVMVRSLHNPIDVLFKAHGDIKGYQIIEGIVLLLPVLLSYVILKCGFSIYLAMSTLILSEVINLICISLLVRKKVAISMNNYIKSVAIIAAICILIAILGFVLKEQFSLDVLPSILLSCLIVIIGLMLFYYASFSVEEKNYVRLILRRNNT